MISYPARIFIRVLPHACPQRPQIGSGAALAALGAGGGSLARAVVAAGRSWPGARARRAARRRVRRRTGRGIGGDPPLHPPSPNVPPGNRPGAPPPPPPPPGPRPPPPGPAALGRQAAG